MSANESFNLRTCETCGWTEYWDNYFCRKCGSRTWSSRPSSGKGTIYSFTEVHFSPTAPPSVAKPFVLALIDLDEGPRVMSHIVAEPDDVRVGAAVTAEWDSLGGQSLPLFRLAS